MDICLTAGIKKEHLNFIKYFLILFLPLSLILLGITCFVYFTEIKASQSLIMGNEKNVVSMLVSAISYNFDSITSDLMILSENNELSEILETNDPHWFKALEKEFLSWAARKEIYDQIRFLDETGMEIIRINYNKGKPYIVEQNQLQNKKGRYYFDDTFKLDKGEIFISPFDLNIEKGQIEQPLKPMIRFGTPVFDRSGIKRGIVLLNYFGANIIRDLEKSYVNSPGQLMLLNKNGFWLKCPVPENEWGFMYEDRKNRTFQKFFGKEWKTISADIDGQISSLNGLFTFSTIFPIDNSFKPESAGKSIIIKDTKYYWKIVSYITHQKLAGIYKDAKIQFLQLNLGVIPILMICSFTMVMTYIKQKKAETGLKNAKIAAESANQAKSDFLANMSHEIRTPMGAVLGLTQLVMKTELTAKQFDYLNKIEMAGQSLLRIINDILDFSKIEAGKLEIENRAFNLDAIMENLANVLNVKAVKKKSLKLFFSMGKDVPKYLIGDPLRLGQILINLGNNALKFTETGEIIISTDIVSKNELNITLKFQVKDSGIGMTEAQTANLFQPFTQADSSTARKYGGTGLGLTICKRLVEMMDGKISIQSNPGQGTIFSFTAIFGISKQKQAEKLEQENQLEKIRGAKILVVDDNEINRQIAGRVLEAEAMIVDFAENGKHALDAVQKNPYDLVLMDIQMPEMDGYKATKKIRNCTQSSIMNYKSLPIIAMTANAMAGEKKKCLEAGLSDYISKPIDINHLFSVLLKWISPEKRLVKEKLILDEKTCQSVEFFSELNGINTKQGVKRVLGNQILYRKILKKFYKSHVNICSEIQEALEKDNNKDVLHLVHTIKGVSGNIGAEKLYNASEKLEREIKNHEINKSTGLPNYFLNSLNQVLNSIDSLKKTQEKNQHLNNKTTTKIRPLFLKIKELLEDDDMEAQDYMDCIKNQLANKGFDSELSKIDEYIAKYDFENALKSIDKLMGEF